MLSRTSPTSRTGAFIGGTALCRTHLDGLRLSEDVDLWVPKVVDGASALVASCHVRFDGTTRTLSSSPRCQSHEDNRSAKYSAFRDRHEPGDLFDLAHLTKLGAFTSTASDLNRSDERRSSDAGGVSRSAIAHQGDLGVTIASSDVGGDVCGPRSRDCP